MKKDKTKENNINIELDESIAQGLYSNLVIVNHSPTEFVLDFINVMPGAPKAKVRSRIILTPDHTKKFINALGALVRTIKSCRPDSIKPNSYSQVSQLAFFISHLS